MHLVPANTRDAASAAEVTSNSDQARIGTAKDFVSNLDDAKAALAQAGAAASEELSRFVLASGREVAGSVGATSNVGSFVEIISNIDDAKTKASALEERMRTKQETKELARQPGRKGADPSVGFAHGVTKSFPDQIVQAQAPSEQAKTNTSQPFLRRDDGDDIGEGEDEDTLSTAQFKRLRRVGEAERVVRAERDSGNHEDKDDGEDEDEDDSSSEDASEDVEDAAGSAEEADEDSDS